MTFIVPQPYDRIFDPENPENLENLIDDNTKAILFETLSNPQISVAKVDEIVKIANKFKIATIADNTVATPTLYNPLKDGVSVVIHSASKYISGQGLSLGGVVIANKNLNNLKLGDEIEITGKLDEYANSCLLYELLTL